MLETRRLTAILEPGWRADPPLYRSLARTLRGAIASGELPGDARLPSERELAVALSVSRATIVNAYDTLRDGGWVTRRGGSGTFVAARNPRTPLRMYDMVAATRNRGAEQPPAVEEVVNLSVSSPRPLTEMLRIALLESADRVPALAEELEYATAGLPRLRGLLADLMTARGLPTDPGQMIVTSGAQQAISLLVRLFLRPGDPALVESPTYLGAVDILRAAEANLIALPVSDGFDVHQAIALIERTRPKLAFLMPNCHTVTGRAIAEPDRAELAALAADLQLPVIEDDIFADLTEPACPGAPIAAFDEDAPVFTIGSLSKLVWNGLRVGWLRAPEAMVTRLLRMKGAVDLGSSIPSQAIAISLLERRASIVRARRQEMIAARSHASDLLRVAARGWTWNRPRGGRSLWVRLPTGSATTFAAIANRHGVIVVPGPALSPDDQNDDHLRLMFVQPKTTMNVAVTRLARAWKDYEASL